MRRVVFGLLLTTAIATPVVAGTPPWTISEASQGVMINHAGQVKGAARGGKAEPGDVITTGPNARAVLVRGEEYAVVAPNSRLQVADPAATGGLTQFLEKIGNVVFSVKKMANPHFGVQTPYLAAVVKGTTFSVTVDDSGASVQVVEGAVEVATHDGGAREVLRPGSIASVGAGDLGALTIQGATTRTIHSASTPSSSSTAQTGAVAAKVSDSAPATTATAMTSAVSETATSTVQASRGNNATSNAVTINAVNEPASSLSNLTGGLVSGQTGAGLAAAASSASGADHAVALATDRPTAVVANGNANSNAGGNSAGNAPSNSNAGGNSANAGSGNNAGGNSAGNAASNSNAGGNSANAGSGNNAGGNSAGNAASNSNAGGNSANAGSGNNAGGNSASNAASNSNAGGNSANASSGSNAGGNSSSNAASNSNAGGNSSKGKD